MDSFDDEFDGVVFTIEKKRIMMHPLEEKIIAE